MSARIVRADPTDAYDLIYPDHLSKLHPQDQTTMRQWITASSDIWIGYDNHSALGAWGLVAPTLLSDRAYLWLFVTENLRQHEFMFIRHSQRAVAEMLNRYSHIYGHTVVGNTKAIRWLKWLGAEFAQPEGQAIPFEIRSKHG